MLVTLFQSIDNKDASQFSTLLTPNCTFTFGNQGSIVGRENIQEYVAGFFDSIAAINHTIEEHWKIPSGHVCHGTVTYTRLDNSSLTVPYANILKVNSDLVENYHIYVDTSELYP